jgi:peptidoglycan hydrolase CwlO-like protein
MDKAIAELSGKLKALSFRINKTDELIDKADKEALERQRTSIATISSTVNTLKETIEEKNSPKGKARNKYKNGATKQRHY